MIYASTHAAAAAAAEWVKTQKKKSSSVSLFFCLLNIRLHGQQPRVATVARVKSEIMSSSCC